ncbi:preprotein translocase subunit SecG [Candidatus Wolfebacteria bacterium RIFCSPLOWO2_01_FULL_38_11]|uniref:Protein-export membrane protein SecG n=2 Tax=Candidatus Wolfeibacteriota TaxID=1752735 RepID=A0A0G0FQH9_9BACT|nr:MAG: Preprotein translocase, SecG subunit [Candidatus Wolfebacteria bacterium GW2011_GWC1_37_10]OGM91791.1 MAG: preprotein translocase subunit SecG [Candidatus Wolfebacteria bacterium RIFCSPLOWO2_01_FULL_38_11]
MYISIAQVVVSVILIALILLQERSSGLSGVFGGSESGFYQTRRGLEKVIFGATIVLIIVLVGLSLVNLLWK